MFDGRRIANNVNRSSVQMNIDELNTLAELAVQRYVDATNSNSNSYIVDRVAARPTPIASNDNMSDTTDIDEALADIARESTQQQVATNLEALISDTEMVADTIIDSNEKNISHLTAIETSLYELTQSVKSGIGFMVSSLTGRLVDINDTSSQMAGSLEDQTKLEQERREQELRDLALDTTSEQEMFESIEGYTSSFMRGLSDLFERVADTIEDMVERIISGNELTIMDQLISWLVKVGVMMTGAIIAFSGLLDLVVNPEGFVEYFKSFTEIWGAFAGAFQRITDSMSSWWSGQGEEQVNSLGAFVNDYMNWLTGTAFPAIIRLVGETVGTLIKTTTGMLYGLIEAIKGLFTLDIERFNEGTYAFSEALVYGFLNLVDSLVTFVLRLFNVDEMLGMGEDQTFGERIIEVITGFYNSIVEYLSKGFWAVLEDVGGIVLKLYDTIYTTLIRAVGLDKLLGMGADQTLFERIVEVYNMIIDFLVDVLPSYNDIARYVNDVIDGLYLPDWLKEQMRLSLKPEQIRTATPIDNGVPTSTLQDVPVEAVEPTPARQESLGRQESYLKEKGDEAKAFIQTIIDNKRIDASVNSSTNVSGNGGGAGYVSTRPDPAPLDRILYGNTDGFRAR